MLLRSSALIYPGLYLVTLGNSCRYAIVNDDTGALTLTDPGCGAHGSALEERCRVLGLDLKKLQRVILTHLDADRIALIPALRRIAPKLQVFGSTAMHNQLLQDDFITAVWEADQRISAEFDFSEKDRVPFSEFKQGLRIDKHLADSDLIHVSEDLSIRAVTTPGHRAHSTAYLVLPHEFVIADETFGYFQGRRMASPGGDWNLTAASQSIKKFSHIELSGIGFPYVGVITGEIVRKHLDAVVQNANDLIEECAKAAAEGVVDDEIRAQVREALFTTTSRDPLVIRSLEATFEAVWAQIVALRTSADATPVS